MFTYRCEKISPDCREENIEEEEANNVQSGFCVKCAKESLEYLKGLLSVLWISLKRREIFCWSSSVFCNFEKRVWITLTVKRSSMDKGISKAAIATRIVWWRTEAAAAIQVSIDFRPSLIEFRSVVGIEFLIFNGRSPVEKILGWWAPKWISLKL